MCHRDDNCTVDKLLAKLSKIYKDDYVAYKSNEEPYKSIIDKVKPFKNSANFSDLILAIQEKLNSKETFLNLEKSIWSNLLIILGLFTGVFGDFISTNYENTFFKTVPKRIFINIVIIIALIEIALYIISVLSSSRKQNKEKCFYKFVYDILTQQENSNYCSTQANTRKRKRK